MEPSITRGIKTTITSRPLVIKLGINDGFYSKDRLAVEGSFGITFKNFSTSFIIFIPDKNTPPNETTYIANKQVFDIVTSYNVEKLTIGSDLLYVRSPKSSTLGYSDSSSAYGLAGFLEYDINDKFSLCTRLENMLSINLQTTQTV